MSLENNELEQAEDAIETEESETNQDDDFELVEIELEEDETEEDAEQSEESEEESDDNENDSENEEQEEESPTSEEDDNEAPGWVKKLRKSDREKTAEIKRLKKALEEKEKVAEPIPALEPKPTLDEFDYDTEEFEKALLRWNEKNREIKARQEKEEEQKRLQQEQWQAVLNNYADSRQKLKAKDYEVSEQAVQNSLSEMQQSIILQVADDPALLVYAIGKNPEKTKQFMAIDDPLKLAKQIALFESKLKVSKKSATPPPEKRIKGASPVSVVKDKKLEELRKKAEQTGDYSPLTEYKRSLRNK